MKPVAVKEWSELADRVPVHALVANVDLVVVRVDDGADTPVIAIWRLYDPSAVMRRAIRR